MRLHSPIGIFRSSLKLIVHILKCIKFTGSKSFLSYSCLIAFFCSLFNFILKPFPSYPWFQSLESLVREVESERRDLVCKARSSNTVRTPHYRQLSLIDSFQPKYYKRSPANATHGKYQLVTAGAHLPLHAPQRRYAGCRVLGLVVQTAIIALMLHGLRFHKLFFGMFCLTT